MSINSATHSMIMRDRFFFVFFAVTLILSACTTAKNDNLLLSDIEIAKLCADFKTSGSSEEKLALARNISRQIEYKIQTENAALSCGMVKDALGMPDYGKGKNDCLLEYVFPNAEYGHDYCLRFEAQSPGKIKYARVYLKTTDYYSPVIEDVEHVK